MRVGRILSQLEIHVQGDGVTVMATEGLHVGSSAVASPLTAEEYSTRVCKREKKYRIPAVKAFLATLQQRDGSFPLFSWLLGEF